MNINIDSPQLAALRKEIESSTGSMQSHSGFVILSDLIKLKCKEHISISTLERIWGYSTRNASNVSVGTLDVLSRFVDAKNWEGFCNRLCESGKMESELFSSDDAIDCSTLATGTRLRLAWMPDRVCEVEYLGNNRFVATACWNSSIRPGDRFSCLTIQKGRELYMDNFVRCGEEPPVPAARYVVGQTSGLTMAKIIEE